MRSPQVIGICGYMGSGKTTAAEVLENRGYTRIPLSQILKDMLIVFGLTEEQVRGEEKMVPDHNLLGGKTPRWAMQSLGTEWGRECIGKEVWVRAWANRVRAVLDAGGRVVCDDVRFANEAEIFRSNGWPVVQITRLGCTGGGHSSEEISFTPDVVIANNGTLGQLISAVEEICT